MNIRFCIMHVTLGKKEKNCYCDTRDFPNFHCMSDCRQNRKTTEHVQCGGLKRAGTFCCRTVLCCFYWNCDITISTKRGMFFYICHESKIPFLQQRKKLSLLSVKRKIVKAKFSYKAVVHEYLFPIFCDKVKTVKK